LIAFLVGRHWSAAAELATVAIILGGALVVERRVRAARL